MNKRDPIIPLPPPKMQVVNMFTEYSKLCPYRAMNEPRGVRHYKLHADNSGSHADIKMTSNGFTLTKFPSKSAGLLPREIFKDLPIVTYKGYTSSSKIS